MRLTNTDSGIPGRLINRAPYAASTEHDIMLEAADKIVEVVAEVNRLRARLESRGQRIKRLVAVTKTAEWPGGFACESPTRLVYQLSDSPAVDGDEWSDCGKCFSCAIRTALDALQPGDLGG